MMLRPILVLLMLVGCVHAVPMAKRNSSTTIDPKQRDLVLSNALVVMQNEGWIVGVSDRAAGLVSSQMRVTGAVPCDTVSPGYCASRTLLQITVAESGTIIVNLQRELMSSDGAPFFWYAASSQKEVAPVIAEQDIILKKLLGTSPVQAP